MMLAASPSTVTIVLTSVVAAALVSGVVTLIVFGLGGHRERKERQRQLCADAFATVAAYREYPYMVRRRRGDDDADERVRLSNALSDVQSNLVRYGAQLRVEAPAVADRYDDLVSATRRIAGAYISDAWKRDPSNSDLDVSITDIDLSELAPFDTAFLTAVTDHLSQLPWRGRHR